MEPEIIAYHQRKSPIKARREQKLSPMKYDIDYFDQKIEDHDLNQSVSLESTRSKLKPRRTRKARSKSNESLAKNTVRKMPSP